MSTTRTWDDGAETHQWTAEETADGWTVVDQGGARWWPDDEQQARIRAAADNARSSALHSSIADRLADEAATAAVLGMCERERGRGEWLS